VPSPGMLRGVRRALRAFEPSFLQCGVPLGVTSGAGSRIALVLASGAWSITASDGALSAAGHIVSHVFGSGVHLTGCVKSHDPRRKERAAARSLSCPPFPFFG
jgi:hypothetical protein